MGKTIVKGNKRKALFDKKPVHRSEENLSSDRSDLLTARQRLFEHLVVVVQRHPILVWSGTWVVLMALCWISITGLLHVDTVEIEQPQPQVVADESQIPQIKSRHQAKPASSFGLLAAIAVSCGATSLILAKQFSPKPSQRRLVIKRPAPVPKAEMATRQPLKAGKSDLTKQAAAVARRSSPVATQPTVTVLPPEENNPLDWGDASLADLMDIRKQTSLSNHLQP